MLDPETLPCGLCRLDASGRVLRANAPLSRLLGHAPGGLDGRPFAELLGPGARVYHQLVLWPSLTLNGAVEEVALALRAAQGGDVHVLLNATRHRLPDDCEVVDCAVFPVKARKAQEDSVLEAQRAVDQMPGLLFRLVRDPDGRYRLPFASQGLYGLTRGDPHDLFSDAGFIFSGLHPDDHASTLEALERSRDSLRLRPLTVRLLARDGSQRWMRVHASVRAEPDGSTLWQGSVYDVTQQQLIDERLREVDKLQAVATLAAGVAHDFNNLLGSITGLAELCELDAPPGTPMARNLGRIVTAAQKAAGLVRQLLDFSRQTPSRPEAMRLSTLLDRCGPLLAASLPPHVQLATRVTQDAPVQLDFGQFEQSLLNLVGNAAYAMREAGGTVELVAGRAEDDEAGAPMARLSVIDHGEGMPPELQQKIFEPFFTTKPVGVGTGLGLAAVHGVVTGHGGFVQVESQPGRGTAFHLLLPCLDPEPGAATPTHPEDIPP